MSGVYPEVDASVCYRHPDRTSWTLCERCGRTICPECQILTPQGVRCPTCIEELGGSVQWTPASGPRPKPVKPKRVRARASSESLDDRPAWQRNLREMLRPGGGTPALSWGAAALAVLIWIPGFFTDLPALWLAVLPGQAPLWQLWRFVTTSFVYPGGLASILSILLGIVFLLLNGPMVERTLGRARFAALFLTSGAMGAAWMAIAGLPEYGLLTPLFGIMGCFLVLAWDSPPARVQLLISLAVLVVLNLVLSPFQILAMIGAFGAGAGVMLLLRRSADRPGSGARPYLLMAGGVLVFVVIAIVRQLVLGA
jgi:membrane associated rhomboid family serine protease